MIRRVSHDPLPIPAATIRPLPTMRCLGSGEQRCEVAFGREHVVRRAQRWRERASTMLAEGDASPTSPDCLQIGVIRRTW